MSVNARELLGSMAKSENYEQQYQRIIRIMRAIPEGYEKYGDRCRPQRGTPTRVIKRSNALDACLVLKAGRESDCMSIFRQAVFWIVRFIRVIGVIKLIRVMRVLGLVRC